MDNLPIGHEKEFLVESFEYCPDCGAVWTVRGNPLDLFYHTGQAMPHRNKADIAYEVYEHYTIDDYRDYILGVFAECDNNMDECHACWLRYLQHAEKQTDTSDGEHFLFAADVARRLGLFDRALKLVALYKPSKWTDTEKTQKYKNAIMQGIKNRDTNRLQFGMCVAFPKD